MEFKFKSLGTRQVVNDIKQYYLNLCDKYSFVDVYISTDAQAHGPRLIYATVIGFHLFDELGRGKGATVLYQKYVQPRYMFGKAAKEDFQKLYAETEYSIQVAEYLQDQLQVPVNYIELDYNLDEKYYSNKVLINAINTVLSRGYGYTCKPQAAFTYAADKLAKS